MNLPFQKLSANGNDFVALDNRAGLPALEGPAVMQWLCDRRRGVGADGVLLVENAPGADFRMRIFNPDGSEADMCGNGARACAQFAHSLGIGGTELVFETRAGGQRVKLEGDHSTLWLGGMGEDPGHLARLEQDVRLVAGIQPARLLGFLRVGVPHFVLHTEDVDNLPIATIGPLVRYHESFAPEGTNVMFVQRVDASRVKVRAWEKGVEGETEGCGTGCIAACALLARQGLVGASVQAAMKGGVLTVGRDDRGWNFSGEVHVAFSGQITLPDTAR